MRFALVLSVLLTGCVSVGRKIDLEAVAKIEKGKTTRADVLSLLGSPDGITRDGLGNEVLGYTFVRHQTSPVTFVPIVGAFAGGGDVQTQFVSVTVNRAGVVCDVLSSSYSAEAGHGLQSASRANLEELESGKRPD